MKALRSLVVTAAQALRKGLPGSVGVYMDQSEDPLNAAKRGFAPLQSVMVCAPALLIASVEITSATENSASLVQTLVGEVLISVECRVDACAPPGSSITCASDLGLEVLFILHGLSHAFGGQFQAERQGLHPSPSDASPLTYALRYAAGSKEKYRRLVADTQSNPQRYWAHFYTEVRIIH